jgi:hypothetical protein
MFSPLQHPENHKAVIVTTIFFLWHNEQKYISFPMNGRHATFITTVLILSFFVSSFPLLADTPSMLPEITTDVPVQSNAALSDTSDTTSNSNLHEGSPPEAAASVSVAEHKLEPEATPIKPDTDPTILLSSPVDDMDPSKILPNSTDLPVQENPIKPETSNLSSQAVESSIPATTPSPTPETPAANENKSMDDVLEAPTLNIIFNEIQIEGDTTKDDFIELYNPSKQSYSLKNFEIRRKTQGDTTERGSLLHAFSDDDTIPGKGYLLWVNKDGTEAFIKLADAKSTNKTSPAITSDNSLALFDSEKNLIDAVTWGSGHFQPFIRSIGPNPTKGKSLTYVSDTDSWTISECPTPTNSKGETVEKTTSCSGPMPTPVDTSPQIILSEIRIEGNGPDDEFVELYNAGTGTVNISGFDLIRKYVSETKIDGVSVRTGKEASVIKSFPDFELAAGAYYLWANREGKYASPFADAQTGYSLSENNALALRKKDGTLIDSVSWGSDTDLTRFGTTDPTLPNPGKGSLVRNLQNLTWSVVGKPTPTNSQNQTIADPELPPPPPQGVIRINEIFPNPKEKGEANEWIELRNTGAEPISLLGWTLRSGSGKFTWTEKLPEEQRVIPGGGFLILPRSLTRLSLRNTDGNVTLLAPDGITTMDSVTYEKSAEGASYGLFESTRFRWSKTLTPGSDNVFGKEPKVKKTSIPKNGYRSMLVPFSATGNKKAMKYVWDFGDGHKSYLDTTSHRFAKTGTYEGSLTLRDGIEETVKPFTIRIGKYPNRAIHLTELCPNPAGTDTDNEWVRIKNDDTKRIDLSGWIIASATEKTKLVNHIILTDRSIEPGEEIALTHADSRFTLPNERAVIELRRPDGKTVQTIEYFQDGGAAENAIFTEIDGSTWAWSVPETDTNIPSPSMEADATDEPDIEKETDPYETGMSADPDSDRLSFGEFVSLGTPYDPDLPDSLPRVLGASDDRMKTDGSSSESLLDALFRILNGFAARTI